MDHKLNKSHLLGYLILRWFDKNLTWNPNQWAGIDMVYLKPDLVWTADLLITNMTNWETTNFKNTDQNLVRVWADRALNSDIEIFNIEWSPQINFEV